MGCFMTTRGYFMTMRGAMLSTRAAARWSRAHFSDYFAQSDAMSRLLATPLRVATRCISMIGGPWTSNRAPRTVERYRAQFPCWHLPLAHWSCW
jgi:hypothetical protein